MDFSNLYNSSALSDLGKTINAELEANSKMKVGADIKHPDGYTVRVISGQFLSNGRVSNWWTWRRVNYDGSFGPETSGYGW